MNSSGEQRGGNEGSSHGGQHRSDKLLQEIKDLQNRLLKEKQETLRLNAKVKVLLSGLIEDKLIVFSLRRSFSERGN